MQLLLIDGNHIMYSVLFRYIAKAKKRGDYEEQEATDRIVEKACQQFTTTIRKLARRFRPTHMCVIFDNDGQNFRHRISSIYKANRKERPKEVHPLKQAIYARFREEEIPYFYATDYEGDDLIGTIAEWAEELKRCNRVILCSGDMDLAQLVTRKTHLYLINNGIFTGNWVTHHNVKEMFEVEPDDLPALKALLGDRTDNIKGVSGLRRPNALRLIERYPQLNGFLDLAKGSNKTETLILRNREHVQQNLVLAKIRRDLRFHMRWEDLLTSKWFEGQKSEKPAKPSGKRSGKAGKAAHVESQTE
ncbi:MAG: 5'-3' exonuclease [Tumebacillaceae bacterium]